MKDQNEFIFLSYAREDQEIAEKLYRDLTAAGLEIWFDKESLLPGQKWKIEVKKAIKKCRFFIGLLSSNSVSKRGYVQKEIVYALDELDEFPQSEIFIIPVRVDDCKPTHENLNELNWLDLFPSYQNGLQKLLHVFKDIRTEPTIVRELPSFSYEHRFETKPAVDATIRASESHKSISISTVIDTGADITVIPEEQLKKLGTNLNYSIIRVMDFSGKEQLMRTYFVEMSLAEGQFFPIEVIASNSKHSLLGWDFLKRLSILIDGPENKLKIWKK
jgi:predicted aspartyl protease